MKESLWIALYFNRLAIEVIPSSLDGPRAVLTGQKHQDRVLTCNPAAGRLGVRPGLSVNAALALAPELEVVLRASDLEKEILQELAGWAIQFTPAVSIDLPDVLLLDIHSSLTLFGGLEQLQEQLISGLAGWGYEVTFACAPTALAALWLARASSGAIILEPSGLSSRLAALSIDCLGWSGAAPNMLREMGLKTLGEVIRLPRDGLAQRIGPGKLLELDRGFGRQPEVREFYQPPKMFRAIRELSLETSDCRLLLEALKKLLSKLRVFLLMNQGSVQALWLHLYHYSEPATLIRIGLLRPVTDTTYLLDLIRIRFEGFRFSAPVVSIALQTDLAGARSLLAKDLFGGRPDSDAGAVELIEQLQARLGSRSVYGVRRVSEHRPEAAWKAVISTDKTKRFEVVGGRTGYRPLWMLVEPMALETVRGEPAFPDVLNLESGPERIEAGWWDGGDIWRDYYIAKNIRGMRLWIFKDCRESGWYLHGLFG